MTKYTFNVLGTDKDGHGKIELHIEEHEIDGRYHLVVDTESFLKCIKNNAHLMKPILDNMYSEIS